MLSLGVVAHPPIESTRTFDADARQEPLNSEVAADALVAWVELAYKLVLDAHPESILHLGQYWLGTVRYELFGPLNDRPEWQALKDHPLLQRWIFAASRNPSIRRIYGISEAIGDVAWSSLQSEAYDFLNWILATHSLSETSVYPRAIGFWNDLGQGTETYEFGEILYTLKLDARRANITLGPGMRLCRLSPNWCAGRFEFFEEEPTSRELETRWAVVVSHTRHRMPRPTNHETEESEADHIQAALLALRLVRFESLFTGARYRIGGKGWYKQQTRGLVFPELWRDESARSNDREWSKSELADLVDLGSKLRRITTAAELTQREQSNALKVALRAYNGSFQRRDWQDQLVDLAVALEAVAGRTRGEISYKVALRCALLIGRDWQRSDQVFRAVTSLYGLRSAIVHGGAGELRRKTDEFLSTWALKRQPTNERERRTAARSVALALTQAVIVSAVQLTSDDEFDPRKDTFAAVLDHAALDPDWRRRLQIRAGVLTEKLPHFVAPTFALSRSEAPAPAVRPPANPD
jgi:hypothetical protein